ncbi:hypothetical protein [Yoonia sp.]|uniref:hypothetical protein n=1 Tax=Yoonia sp. TaxID=2212373 RepID=UPI002FDB727E
MGDWLAYNLAFAGGLGVAAAGYYAGFSFAVQATALSAAGFVGLVALLPVMAGFVTFGLIYQLLAKARLRAQHWVNGAAFTLSMTIVCTSLILSQAMGTLLVLLLLLGLLYAGGRIMLGRRSDG